VREQVAADLEALADIASFMDSHTEAGARYQFAALLAEFRKSLVRELDYRQEAANLDTLRTNLAAFESIVVPAPVHDFTTERVLTMQYVTGTKITDLSQVVRLEIDGTALAEDLFRAYLQQILVDGFFHADPHPGNVFLTADGRVALIDLGMVAHVTPRLQDHLLQLLLAVSEGRSDDATAVGLKLGERRAHFDEQKLTRAVADLVSRHQNATLENIQVGAVVLEMARTAADCGLTMPPELTMLGKTLLNLDEVGRTLDPSFNPNAAVRRHASDIMRQRLLQSASPGNLFSAMLDAKEFAERLPGRVNRILDLVAGNELKLKVDSIDETRLMMGLQKIANRITLGLLLASLIVGAALLMQVETSFRILGYPGLAIVFFLLAAAGACALMFSILFGDD
jgi:predicted unusual protein kinase regulating ubiquinone biosynthesis (AarF/ABC1/UbiB family)